MVSEAILETLSFFSFILFHMFRDKSINFSLVPPLLRTLNLPPPPSRVSVIMGVDCVILHRHRSEPLHRLGDKAEQELNFNL